MLAFTAKGSTLAKMLDIYAKRAPDQQAQLQLQLVLDQAAQVGGVLVRACCCLCAILSVRKEKPLDRCSDPFSLYALSSIPGDTFLPSQGLCYLVAWARWLLIRWESPD